MRRFIESRVALAWVFATVGVTALMLSLVILIVSANSIATQIQHERFRNELARCVALNSRNAKAVAGLNMLTVQAKAKDPRHATQIDKSVAAFRSAVIDTLAPKHADCDAYARSQVNVNP